MISKASRISRSLRFGNMAIQSERFKTNESSLPSVSERSQRTSRSCSAVHGRSSPMSSLSFAKCSTSIHRTKPPLFFHRSSVSASKIASRTLLKGVKFFSIALGEDGGSARASVSLISLARLLLAPPNFIALSTAIVVLAAAELLVLLFFFLLASFSMLFVFFSIISAMSFSSAGQPGHGPGCNMRVLCVNVSASNSYTGTFDVVTTCFLLGKLCACKNLNDALEMTSCTSDPPTAIIPNKRVVNGATMAKSV